ncbi:MAG: hypothetical protein J6R41_10025, partial [Paludibacteraceae bacterium]|nr:hypothetical protein [Paludibacteraceae bacterium]
MRLFISTILTLFVSVTSFAVTTINVHVTDKNGRPVPDAKVEVSGVVLLSEEEFLRQIGLENCVECVKKNQKELEHVLKYDKIGNWQDCGYDNYEVWRMGISERAGRYEYDYLGSYKTDENGFARVEADGFEEYRISVNGATRYFIDGLKNVKMSVKSGEQRLQFSISDIFRLIDSVNIVYVVKKDPYLDIRKKLPENKGLLKFEDVLKYYPEVQSVRYFKREAVECIAFLYSTMDVSARYTVERNLFFYLEYGEYQLIVGRENGEIYISDFIIGYDDAVWIWNGVSWENFLALKWNSDYKTLPPPDQIQIPTVITPYTQDGLNDDFLPGYEVEIFDYYGNFVSSSANGWDGRKGSDLAPPGI